MRNPLEYQGTGGQHEIKSVVVPNGTKCYARKLDHGDAGRVLFIAAPEHPNVYFLAITPTHDYGKVTGRQFSACKTQEALEKEKEDRAAAARSSARRPPPAEPPPVKRSPISVVNRNPGLPGRLYTLDKKRHIGPTGIDYQCGTFWPLSDLPCSK